MMDEKQKAILADYVEGALSVRQIARKHNVSHNYPGWLAAREKVTRRGAYTQPMLPVPIDSVTIPIETGEQFRAARLSLGLSVVQLARKLGVSERALRSWELPQDAPSQRNPNRAACAVLAGMVENERNKRTIR